MVGSTPWSGQRAAVRRLWPAVLPNDFTVDLELVMHWTQNAKRFRPVIADDWTHPLRAKPGLMAQELEVLLRYAIAMGRLAPENAADVRAWYEAVHSLMARYRPQWDDPQDFERRLLLDSLSELNRRIDNTEALSS